MRAFFNVSPNNAFANRAAQQVAVDALLAGVFGHVKACETTDAATSTIAIDVAESETAYTVYAALPGVAREAIDVKVEGKAVAISAKLPAPRIDADTETWLRNEGVVRNSADAQTLERRFSLRHELDAANVAARYVDGVLTLTLPKKTLAAAASITIQ